MGCEDHGRGWRYEIRLVGRLGPALRLAFPGLDATVEPRHCVSLVAGGEDLPDVLARLGRRHVELVRARLRSRVRTPIGGPGPPACGEAWPTPPGVVSSGNTGTEAVAVNDHLWEIHLAGPLPDGELAELEGLDVAVQPATTVLYGRLEDEAALHGVLDRVQSLGLRLVEVRQLPEPTGTAPK